jgi:hypothetical protein
MERRELVALVFAGLIAGFMADVAGAAVFAHLLRRGAHPGELVGARVDEWTATHHPPLYLIPERSSFAFTTTRWPLKPPFVRLRKIEWGRVTGARATIRFRVPKLRPTRYRLVIYCEPCTQGPRASVIGSLNTLRIR